MCAARKKSEVRTISPKQIEWAYNVVHRQLINGEISEKDCLNKVIKALNERYPLKLTKSSRTGLYKKASALRTKGYNIPFLRLESGQKTSKQTTRLPRASAKRAGAKTAEPIYHNLSIKHVGGTQEILLTENGRSMGTLVLDKNLGLGWRAPNKKKAVSVFIPLNKLENIFQFLSSQQL